jgi:hypothetical protein
MNRRVPVFSLCAALALTACSSDVVAPVKTPTGPALSVSAQARGDYVVTTNGKSLPAGFAEKVASLGGKVSWASSKAGFAAVSGLTQAGASQVRALSGIADVQADAVITLDAPIAKAEADVSDVANPSINSQENPAAGVRAFWQWNMRLIGADKAWAAHKLGDAGVTVAILDTGIDYDDLDVNGLVDLSRSTSLMDSYVMGPTETVVRPSDNALTASFFPTRNPISDYNGHGTNVAQQVSSKAFAFGGVTSKTTLIGVKVLGSNGSGSFASVIGGVIWAAEHGADVANMSLGGGFAKAGNGRFVGMINKVFNYANQQGMLVVVSAGNSSIDLQHNGNVESTYCDSPHVICVSAVGPTTYTGNGDVPAFFTNFGRNSVDVAAPGGNAAFDAAGNLVTSPGWPWGSAPNGNDIASWVWGFCSKTTLGGWTAANTPILTACTSGGRLTGFIGTSQASPHVAGLAALLVAQMGHGQPQLIKQAIENSAAPINPLLGRGRISVSNALGL